MNYEDLRVLNQLRDEVHADAVARGFYYHPKEIGTQLMLIVSELGEAVEADRRLRHANMRDYYKEGATPDAFVGFVKDTFEDEIADALIRILDLCGAEQIDIVEHVVEKLAYNRTRPVRHGKVY